MAEKLLYCPFCGEKALARYNAVVRCEACWRAWYILLTSHVVPADPPPPKQRSKPTTMKLVQSGVMRHGNESKSSTPWIMVRFESTGRLAVFYGLDKLDPKVINKRLRAGRCKAHHRAEQYNQEIGEAS